jgi:transcription initiation factor TFIIE subunit alpha
MESWGDFSVEPEDRKPDLAYLNGRGPSYPPSSPAPGDPYRQGQIAGANGNGLNIHGKRPREEDGYGFGYGNGGGENGGEMALAEEVGFVADIVDDPIVNGTSHYALLFLL